MEEPLLALHVNQFLVCARLYSNYHRVGGDAGRHGHNSLLHRLELAAAIRGDDQIRCRSQSAARQEAGRHQPAQRQPKDRPRNFQSLVHIHVSSFIGHEG